MHGVPADLDEVRRPSTPAQQQPAAQDSLRSRSGSRRGRPPRPTARAPDRPRRDATRAPGARRGGREPSRAQPERSRGFRSGLSLRALRPSRCPRRWPVRWSCRSAYKARCVRVRVPSAARVAGERAPAAAARARRPRPGCGVSWRGRSGARAAGRHAAARERSLRLDGLTPGAAGRVRRSTPPRTDHRRERRSGAGQWAPASEEPGGVHGVPADLDEVRRPSTPAQQQPAAQDSLRSRSGSRRGRPPRPTARAPDRPQVWHQRGRRALAAAAVSRAERNPSGAETSAAGYRFARFDPRVARGGGRSVGVVGRRTRPAAYA